MSHSVPFSILDLAPIGDGQSVADAIENSKSVAACADDYGYQRIWLAEHHGTRGVASSATAVMLAAIGAVTKRIRIGAGGVMLPNHSPLVIAEQFGTLAAMYPDRVDLGLGRAPGTDMMTARALRRNLTGEVDQYPDDVAELQGYFSDDALTKHVIAIPGEGSHVPLWLLGSSLYSAQLAAYMGLPFSFASHFAPDMLLDAITVYRANFRPSKQLQKPFVSAGVMASVADSQADAEFHFTSAKMKFAHLRRGTNVAFPKPVDDMTSVVSASELGMINSTLRYAMVGTQATVSEKLAKFIEATQIDEVIFSFPIHDVTTRLHAIKLTSELDFMKRA
ncbi:LLM class flavin-dependent oxidoreductase [Marinomonas sp. 15G1-11]|uniref:LLM class flavin-dependent oxidoreductase n=1 Tax=Marinomonas phaeophyticola TaxID=3004091 RepID=A0ABT4JVT0_9GAMM|nr:LLM class flavin-dependent oxidoreductase [Marinomonas sp. 15G1-11]MCZ2721893.1 LLM class flavin-dependent oxidoreductase [Marinomonas sp. 15G1-11]